jgi:hypothetical protein
VPRRTAVPEEVFSENAEITRDASRTGTERPAKPRHEQGLPDNAQPTPRRASNASTRSHLSEFLTPAPSPSPVRAEPARHVVQAPGRVYLLLSPPIVGEDLGASGQACGRGKHSQRAGPRRPTVEMIEIGSTQRAGPGPVAAPFRLAPDERRLSRSTGAW